VLWDVIATQLSHSLTTWFGRSPDRSAWIAKYRSPKSVGVPKSTGSDAPASASASAASSEAPLEERLNDRQQWIKKYRQKTSQRIQRRLSSGAATDGETWISKFNEDRAQ
jgi:hypothetical protein